MPDVFTYASLIEGMSRGGRHTEAEGLWQQLQVLTLKVSRLSAVCSDAEYAHGPQSQAGLVPDQKMFSVVVGMHCRARRMESARAVLAQMKAAGHAPEPYVYRVMLSGYSKSDQPDEAVALLTEMVAEGVRMDVKTWPIVVSALARHGRTNEALAIAEAMREIAEGVQEDSAAGDSLDQPLRPSYASPGAQPGQPSSGGVAVVDGGDVRAAQSGGGAAWPCEAEAERAGEKDEGEERAIEMWPEWSGAALIQVHARAGDIASAEQVFMDQVTSAGHHNLKLYKLYTSMIGAYSRAGMLEV